MHLLLALATVMAGALVPVQAGINASLRHFLPHPVWAAVTNFTVGLAVLSLAAVAMQAPLPAAAQVAKAPWWYWLGGSMGAVLVLSGILFSHRLGAATFVGCIILGQLTASVVCDHFGLVGYPAHAANLQRIGGLVLLAGGVWLVRSS